MTLTRAEKTRENRVRRRAAGQWLTLSRSRIRDPMAANYGKYMLREIHEPHLIMIAGETLDAVEAWLESPRARVLEAERSARRDCDGDGPVTANPRIPVIPPGNGAGSEARVTETGPEVRPGSLRRSRWRSQLGRK